jgi:hypothetical protein
MYEPDHDLKISRASQKRRNIMKTIRTMIITAVFVALASSAFAVGNATLTVTADVLPTCSFTTTTATLAFGSIDPTAAVDATASTSISYNCSSGLGYTFNNDATAIINNVAPDNMTVDLAYVDAGIGTGTGVDTVLTI